MSTFYHAASSDGGTLGAGFRPGLVLHSLTSGVSLGEPERGFQSDLERALWPNGISGRGRKMLTTPYERYGDTKDWRRILIEYLFELVRRERFPHKPSRFTCIYGKSSPGEAFGDLAAAGLVGRVGAGVWELAAEDWHAGDYRWLWRQSGGSPLETMACAERFWRGELLPEAHGEVEYLLNLPVTVVRQIDGEAPRIDPLMRMLYKYPAANT